MDIIVTGSIAYDYLMRFPGHFSEHFIKDQLHRITLSFLVEDMTRHWGGIGANIAFTLGLLGIRSKLFGTAGRDFTDYREWLEKAGVDTSTVQVIESVFCASFFANTDLDNNQISSFYSGAMEYSKQFTIADIYDGIPDYVIISPSDPTAMLQLAEECRTQGIRFIADPGQQVARFNGAELKQFIEGAYALFANDYEASLIVEKTGISLDEIQRLVEVVVVTHGPDGSVIYVDGGQHDIPVVTPDQILDPTGVGDAYRAGFLYGLANRLPLKVCGEIGALAATYALEQVGPQSHHFTHDEFFARFRQHFGENSPLLESGKSHSITA
ncbi:MAG: carbohydrate kinase family protein [Anaerolineae bacterium]|nr:carbohydrate kinase family protein [Anaerolineae bacterium]